MAGLRLTINNGVVVDDHLATSDSDFNAAGDIDNAYYPLFGTHLRLEHWPAALNQGPVAAAKMVGPNIAYDRAPYFFSDQCNLDMEHAGYVNKHVTRRRKRTSHHRVGGRSVERWTTVSAQTSTCAF